MGERIVYYQSKTGENLSKHLQKDYPEFRQWILAEDRSSTQEYGERLLSDKLERYLIENDSLKNFENTQQEIIDELTAEYFLVFCDFGPGKDKFEIVGPMMSTRRYETFKSQVLKTEDTELKSICSILDNGRSLIQGQSFIPNNDNYKIVFWTVYERLKLERRLKESKKLFGHTEGFEYIISALEEIKYKDQELVISIEE